MKIGRFQDRIMYIQIGPVFFWGSYPYDMGQDLMSVAWLGNRTWASRKFWRVGWLDQSFSKVSWEAITRW